MKNRTTLTRQYFLTRKPGFFAIVLFFLLLAGALGNAALRQAKAKASSAPPPAASDELWQDVSRLSLPLTEAESPTITRAARTLRLNRETLARTLAKAPLETKGTTHETLLSLPLPGGGFAQFRLEASPVLPPILAAKYPQIQSYRGEAVGLAATMRGDWSPRGFHATIMQGNQLINIQPLSPGDTQHYASFYDSTARAEAAQVFCQVKDTRRNTAARSSLAPTATAELTLGATRKTYRLAIATTQEYTNAATLGGGTVVNTMASLTTWLNALNVVYERELAVRFVLAEDNDKAIYTVEPDPFTNGNASQMLNEVTAALKDKVGVSKYDLGHVLGTGGGGIAGLGVVCQGDDKSLGVSLVSATDAVGTGFSLQTLLHEIGHQFSATHTFSAECDFNRTDATAYESGAGLTIMSYAGACTPAIVSTGATHFHSASIAQMLAFINDPVLGGSCAVTSATGNTAPAVNPGIAFTIPKQTPFVLTATGSDADAGDFANLTYSWEQVDAGPTPPFVSDVGPLFRPFAPTTNPTRYFPSLTYILNNANVPPTTVSGFETAENLPTDDRTLNFNSIVRDNRGGIASEAIVLTVAASGPFAVTAPNAATTWTGGMPQTVTWSVNGTDAAPVSCANVRISMSTDGGNTFPYELASSVPNTGSATVTPPVSAFSTRTRIKVEAVGNIFFDLSDTNFTVNPNDGCPAIASISPLIGPSGTTITMTGVNLLGVTDVAFPGNVAAAFTITNDNDIRVTVPPGATSGYITVSKAPCDDKLSPFFTVSTGSSYTRKVDNDTFEASLTGLGASTFHYVNRLTPLSYPATSREMRFFIPATVPIGTTLNLIVGVNPTGTPAMRNVEFQSVPYVTTSNGAFAQAPIPNVTVTSGDLVVGYSHALADTVFPIPLDTDGTIAGRSHISSNAGVTFTAIPNGNFLIQAIFSPGAICTGAACTPANGNAPPVLIPAAALTRLQGTTGITTQIATASDFESAAGALTITKGADPAGLTVTNLTNNNGVISARIDTDCGAAPGLRVLTLTAKDESDAESSINFIVNVTANTAPVLADYPNAAVGTNGSVMVSPAAAPSDNGAITSLTATSPTFSTSGTLFANLATGIISITNAGLLGTHTITVTATDNCGVTSTKSFQLTVVPALTITSLSPTMIQAKSNGFALTVNGTGFTANSTVRWNGVNRATTFDSITKLIATIPAADINLNAAGSANITVFDSGTTLTSNTQVFTITAPNPMPTITALNPASALVGGASFPLIVTGTNFVDGAQITFNGSVRATTFLNATQLSFSVTTADLANTGTPALTVTNPAPGGGISNSVNLPITNPVPGALTLNPASVIAGSGAAMVTVTGTNFRPTSVVRVNGTARTTMFVSVTELKATLDAADVLNAGTLKFTAFTAEPGGGASPEANFTVNNPAPTLTSLTPASVTTGGADFVLTLTGTNFVNGAQVKFNGVDRTTTLVSATSLTIAVTAAETATAGSATISVTNPTPGGGASNQLTLPINNPAPTLTSLTPASALIGTGATTVTLTGTGYRANSVARVNGVNRTTTFVSTTELRIELSAAELSAAATLKLSVSTPAPGGGDSVELNFTVGNPVPAITSLAPAAVNAGGAAFQLAINGTGFLLGSQVKFNGTDRTTTFVNATQLTIAVTAADIATAGSAALTVINPAPGGGTSNTANLPINNATPGTLTLTPNSALVGSAATLVTVTGTGFSASSVIRVNNADRPTIFISETQLTTQLTVTDLASIGTLKIAVNTPPPGGGLSPEATFTINNPTPNLTGLTPAAVIAGGTGFQLTITGSGFVAGSQVKINGTDRTTTFVSATTLTVTMTAADIVSTGIINVTVVNATPGGGTSNQLGLPINNPAPTLTSLNPSSALLGSAATVVTLTGTDFRANSVVRVNGSDRATNFVNATQVQITLSAGDLAASAILKLAVSTPSPGGGTSAELNFNVGNVVPAITTLSPTVAIAGGADFVLTINGTNFINGSQVKFNGADRTTTFVSATNLTIAVTAAEVANTGTITIAVANPAPGGGTSNTVNLPINNPVPGALTLAPNAVIAGSGATNVSVTGTNFRSNSIVRVNGTDRPTTFVSVTQLTANLTANDVLNAGTLKFTVFTPEPGGGTSPEANFIVNNPAPTLTSLNPASVIAGGADFVLTLTGANFINGSQVKFNGADRATTFVSATTLTIAVTAADLANAGSATISVVNSAPGGGTSGVVNLLINNPAPTLTSANPTTAVIGSAAMMATLTGTGFRANSVVRVNGTDRATTFVSATSLQVTLTAADLSAIATLKLIVFTPTPGGGTTAEVDFSVTFPAPTIASLSPTSALSGGAAFTLTINGTNFINGSQVKFNGADRTTTFVNATQLTIAVAAADIAAPGTITIAVANPAPGGGTSNTVNLPINNPVPGALTLAPNAVIAGSGASAVTVSGTNFRANSIVRVNGADRTTMFVSVTELKVNLTASDVLNAGTLKFTVFTPEPGGGASPEANFIVNNPAPVLSALNPASVTLGSAGFALTITGSNFINGSQVKFNGSDRATTFVNATQLTIAVTAADLANAGSATITVVNSAPGGGASNTLSLAINNPAPTLTALDPTTKVAGSAATVVTLTGTNFQANSVARVNGADRATTFVNATSLQVTLSAADLAAAATLKLIVFTPAPGGGASAESNFTVGNPVPAIASLNPASAAAGGSAFSLTITGSNFINGSQVKFNGADRATAFVSATTLTIEVTAADLANVGTATIAVVNPGPGGGTSNTVNLPINNPAPGAITLSPTSAIVGGGGLTLTINGSNFRANSVARVNGGDRTTTFVSATNLTIQLTAADVASVGTLKLTVNTPAPGGGLSPEANFSVNNPAPTLTSLNPGSATAGGSTFFLTVNGTGFLAGTIVKFNGTERAATVVNGTQLTITISTADLANAGSAQIVVVNPTPGGGTSNELALPINNPAPTNPALTQTSVTAGAGAMQLTLTGNGFRPNSVVRVNGANRVTTFVSATELKVALLDTDVAAAGTLKLVVFTPEPGGGLSPEVTLSINNPAPTLTSLNPNSAAKGDAALTLTVTGTGFINGSIVRWNGADRVTTFVSATTLTAAIPASDFASEGSANVTVFTPAPGGGTSSAVSFTIRPAGFEADVAPRPNGTGNGTVSIADWTQLGRFVAGLDTVTNGNEFQRADSAPRDAKGDGRITIADWVQAGRYAAGLDPVVSTGGPTQPVAPLTNEFSLEAGSRVIRALNGNWLRGQLNTLRIEMDAQGNENALGFSLDFDPSLLSFYSAVAESGAIVTINQQLAAQGRLGFIVAMPAGQQFVAGTRTVLQVQFVPKGGADNATTTIRFGDQVIRRDLADALANTLTGTTFVNADIAITGRATAHVSAASYLSNDAAGDSIVSAFGVDLATMTVGATVTPLPSLLGGTRVVVKDSAGNERVAALFFVSPTQINYLIPPDTANGLANITITNGAGLVSRGVVNITRTAAGLFSADATGKGFAAATLQRNRAGGSVSYEAVTRFDPARGQIVGVPIEFNDGDELFLALYGTGLRQRTSLTAIKAKIGGVETEVLYAGAQGQYAGLDQVNVRIPRHLRGEVVIELTVDGQAANPLKVQMR